MAKRPLKPIQLLVSEEPLLVTRAVTEILDEAVPEQARGFNYDVLEAKSAGATGILSAAKTIPMMAKMRMVVVRNFHSLGAPELKKLAGYLDDPCPSTALVLLAKKIDGRLKFYSKAKKLGFVETLSVPRNASPWLSQEVKRQGVKISSRAQRRLLEVIGNDLARLALSLEQLALFADGNEVSVDDVDELIAETRERTVFELTDAIGAGDKAQAHRAVSALVDQRQSAIGVVVMLARHMRQLVRCQEGLRSKLSRADIGKQAGVPPFIVEKLMDQARGFPRKNLPTAFSLLADADAALKGRNHTVRVLGRQAGEGAILSRLTDDLLNLRAG